MSTFRDERRFIESEGFCRDPGPDFSPEAIAAQKAAFLAKGGRVQQIPNGTVTEYKSPSQRAKDVRSEKKYSMQEL